DHSNGRIEVKNAFLSIALLWIVLWGAYGSVYAQPPKTGQDKQSLVRGEETISIDTTEVLLPVTVRDRAGAFVPSMKAEDFTVFEDGIPQPISSFAFKRMPVQIVFLIDTSSSVTKELEDFKAAALKFVERLEPEDKVCLIRFDDVVELVQDWTSSQATF